jgi:phosphomannomutase
VSVSGIRGILGDSLTPQAITKYVSAFAEYCKRRSRKKFCTIVVGRDGRLHGDIIERLVTSCLSMSGVRVLSIGVAPTPTVQIASALSKADGAMAITASHNPQIWNGLKFLNPDGTFLDSRQIEELLTIAGNENFGYCSVNKIISPIEESKWSDRHISEILKLKIIDRDKIRKRKFKVVVDAVNSSGSEIVPDLLEQLGCSVTRLYCDGSGIFPHTPEPLPENLRALSRAVIKHKADAGISVDPDADRLVLIADNGKPIGEENTITMAVRYMMRTSKIKTATVNLSTTRAVDDVAAEFGGTVFRSPVGEINVVKEMMKNGSVIGGEGSGGVILPASHFGRDSLAGIVLILSELANSGLKLSKYKETLPSYFISKAKIENVKEPDAVLNAVRRSSESDGSLLKIWTNDGLKLDFADYWIHLRKSNTEPIIRIITEARSAKNAGAIQEELMKRVRSLL